MADARPEHQRGRNGECALPPQTRPSVVGRLSRRPDAGAAVRDNFLAAITAADHAPSRPIWPLDDELDPRPLFTALHRRGHPIGLPVVIEQGPAAAVPALDAGDGTGARHVPA